MKKLNPRKHPFHLVDASPWPFYLAICLFTLIIGTLLYFHGSYKGELITTSSYFLVVAVVLSWWIDVVHEATLEGKHTHSVQTGLRSGMSLFIISEIMFFFAFFWAFFHSTSAPCIELACVCLLLVYKHIKQKIYLF